MCDLSVFYPAVKFNITDVNLTEKDYNGNPIITHINRKKKVNITISGYFTETIKISVNNVKKRTGDMDSPNVKMVDIKGEMVNITFYSVRIIRDKVYNERLNTIVTPPKLMIDNTHEFYGFLKPIYVNKGDMSILSEQNIYLSFDELKEVLKNSTVSLGVTNNGDDIINHYNWITEYKKGDSNGETH